MIRGLFIQSNFNSCTVVHSVYKQLIGLIVNEIWFIAIDLTV